MMERSIKEYIKPRPKNIDVVNNGTIVRVPKMSDNRSKWKKFYDLFPTLLGQEYYMRKSRYWHRDISTGRMVREERTIKVPLKKIA